MGTIEQILSTPYAYVWLPGLVFFLVVGGVYWLTRPLPPLAVQHPPEEGATVQSVTSARKTADQRFGFRRHGNPVEVFVKMADDPEDPVIGSVLDRSVGGMRLALYQEVAIGTVVAVRPVRADDIVPWVEVEIRSCRPSADMPDHYDIGCQYVKSPPYSIQLLFG